MSATSSRFIAGGSRPVSASWLEISRSALEGNIALYRRLLDGSGTRLGVVLKANAYGHGLAQVLPCVHPLVDTLYVVTAPDALWIRAMEAENGWPRRDVLVIGPVVAEEARALAEASVDVVCGDHGWPGIVASLVADPPRLPLRAHVHVDSGLGREGFRPGRLREHLGFLTGSAESVEVAGILTHFANTEDVTEQAYARTQLEAFDAGERELRAWLAELGRPSSGLVRHVAASAAAMVLPPSRMDVVRLGIALYGLWPSVETRISARLVTGGVPELRPVLAWRVRSQLVKRLPAGSFVGYGCTHRCRDDTRIAVLPVGYFDGYPRLVSNQAHVLVEGRRCPVLGRVMMNHLIVDVSGVEVEDGGEVTATLLGVDGPERVRAEDLAGWAQTIDYEIVSRTGGHLSRRLVQ